MLEVKGDFCHKLRTLLESITATKTTSKSACRASTGITHCTMTRTLMRWPLASLRFSTTYSGEAKSRSGSKPIRTWSNSSSCCTRFSMTM